MQFGAVIRMVQSQATRHYVGPRGDLGADERRQQLRCGDVFLVEEDDPGSGTCLETCSPSAFDRQSFAVHDQRPAGEIARHEPRRIGDRHRDAQLAVALGGERRETAV